MKAEPELFHLVLEVKPSCRILVADRRDLGDQAHLVRASAHSTVVPPHRQSPPNVQRSSQPAGSVRRPGFPDSQYPPCPEKTSPIQRTDRPPDPVRAAS